MLDLRIPIAWYFIINSGLLVLAGLFSGSLSMVPWTQHQSINLNLIWAAVMGMFGLIMLGLACVEKQMILKQVKMKDKVKRQTSVESKKRELSAVASSAER